jgi:7-cyano-7-deazaguanine synthase in queuosine biosynthesis
MKANEALSLLPEAAGCVVILSGGMDSTIAMRLAVEKYGKENVSALTFFYGQKQQREIDMARMSTNLLGVKHKVIDASFLGDISKGFSANVDTDMEMPRGIMSVLSSVEQAAESLVRLYEGEPDAMLELPRLIGLKQHRFDM